MEKSGKGIGHDVERSERVERSECEEIREWRGQRVDRSGSGEVRVLEDTEKIK